MKSKLCKRQSVNSICDDNSKIPDQILQPDDEESSDQLLTVKLVQLDNQSVSNRQISSHREMDKCDVLSNKPEPIFEQSTKENLVPEKGTSGFSPENSRINEVDLEQFIGPEPSPKHSLKLKESYENDNFSPNVSSFQKSVKRKLISPRPDTRKRLDLTQNLTTTNGLKRSIKNNLDAERSYKKRRIQVDLHQGDLTWNERNDTRKSVTENLIVSCENESFSFDLKDVESDFLDCSLFDKLCTAR